MLSVPDHRYEYSWLHIGCTRPQIWVFIVTCCCTRPPVWVFIVTFWLHQTTGMSIHCYMLAVPDNNNDQFSFYTSHGIALTIQTGVLCSCGHQVREAFSAYIPQIAGTEWVMAESAGTIDCLKGNSNTCRPCPQHWSSRSNLCPISYYNMNCVSTLLWTVEW